MKKLFIFIHKKIIAKVRSSIRFSTIQGLIDCVWSIMVVLVYLQLLLYLSAIRKSVIVIDPPGQQHHHDSCYQVENELHVHLQLNCDNSGLVHILEIHVIRLYTKSTKGLNLAVCNRRPFDKTQQLDKRGRDPHPHQPYQQQSNMQGKLGGETSFLDSREFP